MPRRLAFALSELDYNLVGSSAINDSSRFVSVRDVRARVQKVAPFLSLDNDPYPTVVAGRILWVVDGYTTTSRYPYGQFADRSQVNAGCGLDHDFNYVRNSVKATVDAYDGSITLYAVDDADPILRVWRSAFPDLFTPKAEMPKGLVDHLRYPEELFNVQTRIFARYHVTDPAAFYSSEDVWTVPTDAGSEQTLPAEPYYVEMRMPGALVAPGSEA